MVPTTRKEFKEYCLRDLGAPVIMINMDADQIEDRIDEALKYYQEFHYDSVEKIYFKHQITANNYPDKIYQVRISSGTCSNADTKYANGEALIFSGSTGSGAAGTIGTDANGNIITINLTNNGDGYALAPSVTVDSVNGAGAILEAELGGFIELPDSIIGVVNVFDVSSVIISQDIFSVQYQIALNDLWSLSSYSMIPYYTTRMHLSLIDQLLNGSPPIRYQRHRNRLHIDINWDRVEVGRFVIGTCYQKIDPNAFPDVWSDLWLTRYATQLIKRNWGQNMKKFGNQMLPSGIVMNGQIIYDEADAEIKRMEKDMVTTWSIPAEILIG